MKAPIIGITSGEILNKVDSWSPVIHGQAITYINAIIDNGGIPVVLPITTDETIIKNLYDAIDGILLAGGNDIDPSLYSQNIDKTVKDVSKNRDTMELGLLQKCLQNNKPILAICRGMQLINVAYGGTLYQDLPTMYASNCKHDSSTTSKNIQHLEHNLIIKPQSFLSNILNSDRIWANSHHHQGIKTLGQGLRASAWSEDQLIEALEVDDQDSQRFLIGVQSHPESLYQSIEAKWSLLFSSFIHYASIYNQKNK